MKEGIIVGKTNLPFLFYFSKSLYFLTLGAVSNEQHTSFRILTPEIPHGIG